MLEEIRQNAVVEGTPAPVVTRSRRDGWWRKQPTWLRHLVYWLIALGVASLTAFDRSTAPGSASATSGVGDFVWFGWLVVVVILGVLKRLWDKWEKSGSSPAVSP